MTRTLKIAAGLAGALGLGLALTWTALAQPAGTGHGPMHGMSHEAMHGSGGPMSAMGPTAMLTKQDSGSAADMNLVHELLASHDEIRRTVTLLPDGIRTLTESDNPKVAQSIQAHVASMSQRLRDGREFNIFSRTLPVLFSKRDKITSKVEMTSKGAIVTRTSSDPKVVAALQGHSSEVTELVKDGMMAMHRGMMSIMARARGGHLGSSQSE